MIPSMLRSVALFLLALPLVYALGIPSQEIARAQPRLDVRTNGTPYFPSTPESCPVCEKDWPNINSCADAAPVLANFTNVIFNPGAVIDVIKCACTDTFQSAFPQCVNCFQATNQTYLFNTTDLPSLVGSIRQVCAFASTTLGNTTSSSSSSAPASTATGGSTSGGLSMRDLALGHVPTAMALGVFALALML